MKKDDVLRHFGGVIATAKAFDVTRSAVYQWGDVVPERIAYRAQFITGGTLRVDPNMYRSRRARAA